MDLIERIQTAPDDARVAIIYPGGEDIFDVKELKKLADPFRDSKQDWLKSDELQQS